MGLNTHGHFYNPPTYLMSAMHSPNVKICDCLKPDIINVISGILEKIYVVLEFLFMHQLMTDSAF